MTPTPTSVPIHNVNVRPRGSVCLRPSLDVSVRLEYPGPDAESFRTLFKFTLIDPHPLPVSLVDPMYLPLELLICLTIVTREGPLPFWFDRGRREEVPKSTTRIREDRVLKSIRESDTNVNPGQPPSESLHFRSVYT